MTDAESKRLAMLAELASKEKDPAKYRSTVDEINRILLVIIARETKPSKIA
jgi:hypothetical protein